MSNARRVREAWLTVASLGAYTASINGEALPEFGNGVNLGYYYFRDFEGDKYIMTSQAVEYTPGK